MSTISSISRRDRNAVEQLLPLLLREVTADPEQQDLARRAARRADVVQAKELFKTQRAAEERKKDELLRARLEGERTMVSLLLLTNLGRHKS